MKNRTLIWVTVFAITMGIFEGAVVVYLRELYYPNGFEFPLTPISNPLAITELIREFASIIMLISIGALAGNTFSQRFAWFIYSFAIWDIIYYVFLYLILGWPESLLIWDVLFLLPIMWTGPVITPILLSILMILLALIITNFEVKLKRKNWLFLISGSVIVFISFIWDFSKFLIKNISNNELKITSFDDKLFDLSVEYIPGSFPWPLFILGFMVISAGIFFIYRNAKVNLSNN